MASLMEMIFDAIPLAGAAHGIGGETPTLLRQKTVGELSDHLRFLPDDEVPGFTVEAQRPKINPLMTEEEAQHTPIWGYKLGSEPHTFEQITCRVRDDEFKRFLVLEKLEFGYEDPAEQDGFEHVVALTLPSGHKLALDLIEEFRLMTWVVEGAWQRGSSPRWPLPAAYDTSVVHVLAYEINPISKRVDSFRNIPVSHPDHAELQLMLKRCREFDGSKLGNSTLLGDHLFADNLWHPSPSGPLSALPGIAGIVGETVALQTQNHRVIIICTLTPCMENADFQPGAPGGVGRLYPHVMLLSNLAGIKKVDATIQMDRPANQTVLDGMTCGCHEMTPEIRPLLVCDSNADNMIAPDMVGPDPVWNNLFNYYLTNAFQGDAPGLGVGDRPLHVVRRGSRATAEEAPSKLIDRRTTISKWAFDADTPEHNRVTRVARQGPLDNLHMAPRMTMPNITRIEFRGRSRKVSGSDRERLRFNDVVMAPFCAHDCFHIHWRWTDNNNSYRATWGFQKGFFPNSKAGAPMVPENQDVYVWLRGHNQFSYHGEAQGVVDHDWTVICHHGAAYMLAPYLPMILTRKSMSHLDELPTFFTEVAGEEVEVEQSWAAMYWNFRFYMKRDFTVFERTTVLDLDALLFT